MARPPDWVSERFSVVACEPKTLHLRGVNLPLLAPITYNLRSWIVSQSRRLFVVGTKLSLQQFFLLHLTDYVCWLSLFFVLHLSQAGEKNSKSLLVQRLNYYGTNNILHIAWVIGWEQIINNRANNVKYMSAWRFSSADLSTGHVLVQRGAKWYSTEMKGLKVNEGFYSEGTITFYNIIISPNLNLLWPHSHKNV